MMMIKSNQIRQVAFVLILYIFLYIPPFFGVNTSRYLAIMGIIYVGCLHDCINHKVLFTALAYIMLIVYIAMVVFLFPDGSLSVASGLIYIIGMTFPVSIMLTEFAMAMKYTLSDILFSIEAASVLEAIICVISFFSEKTRILLLGFMGYSDRMFSFIERGYGISGSITYAMPILQAVIGIIILQYAIRVNLQHIFAVLLIWFSAVINARTSCFVILVGCLLTVFVPLVLGEWERVATALFVLFCVTVCLIFVVARLKPITARWIMRALTSTLLFLKGERVTDGYYGEVFGDNGYWAISKGLRLVFGNGAFIRSDVGFIRDLYMGGIIFCLFLYALWFIMIRRIAIYMKNQFGPDISTVLFFTFFATLILANIKGELRGVNEIMNFIIMIYVMSCAKPFENDVRRRTLL